jgi:ABC-type multidrug transport system fused ATPase/permease subunit
VLEASGQMGYGERSLPATRAAHAQLADVWYAYDSVDDHGAAIRVPAIRGATIDLPVGATVALVGPTGSGKSTLAGLSIRLVDPDSGAVLVDGVDLREVRHGGVAAVASLVPQQTFLFDDTVRGNVTLGQEFSDAEVWAALRTAQADGFVASLEEGIHTRVGERGTSLSGGQRQRLALARAIIRRPGLLVLDDATSAVDPTVEQAILAALREASAGMTVLVVAYRLATIALADEVAYLERGAVLDRGSHEELMSRTAGYRELVTAYEREAAERAAVAADEEPARGDREEAQP